MSGTRTFKSNPLNRLNIDHTDFKNKLNELSFTSPSDYFAVKRTYEDQILKGIIQQLYYTVYYALTEGKKVDTSDPTKIAATDSWIVKKDLGSTAKTQKLLENFSPGYSEELADELAMNIVATLQKVIQDKIIDDIFSTDQIDRALNRGAKQAESSLI